MISFNSYGEEIKGLFGISLYDNAEKFFSSNYIDSNKFKSPETSSGYFDLIIIDKIKIKSPYFSHYKITIDKENKVHDIYGRSKILANLEICQEIVKGLVSNSEKKYQANFKYWEKTYPEFKKYAYHYQTSSKNLLIQCKEENETASVILQIALSSKTFTDKVSEFYDSGL